LRTLFIHVGPAKTGTSAIQHALRTHEGALVIYPQVGLSKGGSHNNLAANFFADFSRPDVDRSDPGALMEELGRAFAASDRDVVISSEALFGRTELRRFIEALTAQFSGPRIAVEIVVVCREHFGRIASAYNQRVKDVVRFERDAPDAFIGRKNGATFGYAHVIRRLRQTGANVQVLNYHPASTLVERFLRHVGFPDNRIPAAEMRNISLSSKGLIATLAANNVAAGSEDRQRYFMELRKMRGFFGPSGFIFGAEAALEASRRLQPDRQFLMNDLGIELPVPDLESPEGGLHLNDAELGDIRAITGVLGGEGEAIVEFASRFRRA